MCDKTKPIYIFLLSTVGKCPEPGTSGALDPEEDVNGNRAHLTSNLENDLGSIVAYNCNDGYTISGPGNDSPKRICESGNWLPSNERPVCKRNILLIR